MNLWSAEEARRATEGDLQAGNCWSACGISIDSRTLKPGELFVALQDRRDGHEYVASARAAGATAALVSRIPDGVASDFPLLLVPDVLHGLNCLAAWRRRQCQAKVIAITGSVGKTSTKEMLKVICSRAGQTHVSPESYNNHWGVPLTLATMPKETEFSVIEIGMNQPGEIAPLAKLTRPHVGLVTTIAPAHLEAFGSLEAIAEEKGCLFDGLGQKGVAILSSESKGLSILEQHGEKMGAVIRRFGRNPDDYCQLLDIRTVDNGIVMKVRREGAEQCVMLNAFGTHFAQNALGALVAAHSVGLESTLSALALRDWRPPPGRGDSQDIYLHPEHQPLHLINDAFNANPTSVAAAIEALSARLKMSSRSRAVLILGDMLELGPKESDMHAAIAEHPSLEIVDKVHCVGPLMRHFYKRLSKHQQGEWYETAEQLAAIVHRLVTPGDIVLVKGSKGSHLSLVVETIRKLNVSDIQQSWE